jgi:hypothetical protein
MLFRHLTFSPVYLIVEMGIWSKWSFSELWLISRRPRGAPTRDWRQSAVQNRVVSTPSALCCFVDAFPNLSLAGNAADPIKLNHRIAVGLTGCAARNGQMSPEEVGKGKRRITDWALRGKKWRATDQLFDGEFNASRSFLRAPLRESGAELGTEINTSAEFIRASER